MTGKNKIKQQQIMRLIYRVKQLMLLTGDILALALGLYLSLALRYWQIPEWTTIESHLVPFFWLFIIWLTIFFINGLYDLGFLKTKIGQRHFLESAFWSFLIGIIFFYIFPNQHISPKTVLVLNIIFGYGLSYLWRLVYNKFINSKTLQTNIIFIGHTPETAELINILENFPERGYYPVGLIDPDNSIQAEAYPFLEVHRNIEDLKQITQALKAQAIIVAPHIKKETKMAEELYQLLFSNVKIIDLTSFYEVITGRIPPCTFSETWFLEHLKNQNNIIYDKFRSALDIIIASLMMILLIILFPFIALVIKINSPGPIFFKQKRIGRWGKEFTIYKLRSMQALTADGSAETAGFQFAQKNDKRITAVGKILRKIRLDELPQCFNIFRGEITLIGPRPERPEIVHQMIERMSYYNLRHLVKPGLTGWAVIHQNYTDNLDSTLQKLQYDLFYIKNKSLLLDLSIILRTVNIIMRMMGQ